MPGLLVAPMWSMPAHTYMPAGKAHEAEGDLFLCPAVRLLADAPGVAVFEYHGHGHRLVLPDKDNLGEDLRLQGCMTGENEAMVDSCSVRGQTPMYCVPHMPELNRCFLSAAGPPCLNADEPLPLMLVGAGCTLRLRDVKLVNAASLAVCLQLAPGQRCRHLALHAACPCRHKLGGASARANALPCSLSHLAGARLLASQDDGVEMLESVEADADLAHQLSTPVSSPAAGSLMRTPSPRKQLHPGMRATGSGDVGGSFAEQSLVVAGSGTAVQAPGAPPAQQQQQRTIEIVLSAVGLGLQFVHLDSGSSNGGAQRPAGSGPSSGAATRQGSISDLAQPSPQQLAQALAAQPAAPQSARGRPPAGRAVQMLSASLDLSVAFTIEASPAHQAWFSSCMHCGTLWWAGVARLAACDLAHQPLASVRHLPLLLPRLLQDSVQSGHVEVQGLRAETRFISGRWQDRHAHLLLHVLLMASIPAQAHVVFPLVGFTQPPTAECLSTLHTWLCCPGFFTCASCLIPGLAPQMPPHGWPSATKQTSSASARCGGGGRAPCWTPAASPSTSRWLPAATAQARARRAGLGWPGWCGPGLR